MNAGSTYELQVAGHLDEQRAGRLGGLRITHRDDGTTTLSGPVADQSHLHGILAGIRDMGADLLALRRSEPEPAHALPRAVSSDRLTLRPATPDDAEATWNYRRLPEVGEWLTETPTDLASYSATFREPGRLTSTVILERDGHTVGDLMLRVQDAWAQAEIDEQARRTQAELGWVLDPSHHGHGYATEAVRRLIRVCFDDLGLRRVTAACFSDNEASWRLMERVGMRRESHLVRDSLHRSGRWLDSLTYAALADEWPF